MKIIEIFTSHSCPQCPKVLNMVKEIALHIPGIQIVEISLSDPNGYVKAMSLGIRSVPAIFIDGRPSFVGILPTIQTLWQEILK